MKKKFRFKKIQKKIRISKNVTISNKDKCFVVAEISGNHGGNLKVLKKTMLAAKKSGADAIKIQSYEAQTITLKSKNNHFLIVPKNFANGYLVRSSLSSGEPLFSLLSSCKDIN